MEYKVSTLAGLLVAGAVAMGAGPAGAYPMSAWNKDSLKKDFARVFFTKVAKVEELRVHDLKRVRGVVGFTLGRYRSKDGKWTYAGVVVYRRCGKKYCMSHQGLHGADKVRALGLLDLSVKKARFAPGLGTWLSRGGPIKEPPHRARWPVLVVQTEQVHDDRKEQVVSLLSLKDPKRLARLLRLTTRSRQVGEPRKRGHRYPRYAGNRVTMVRLIHPKGKAPRLEVLEVLISTRYDRCLKPKPVPVIYELKKGRFARMPGKAKTGGCR